MKWMLGCVLALAGAAFGLAGQGDVPPRPATVFVLRHAETVSAEVGGRDRELSAAGEERAARLAQLLAPAGVTHVFASEFRRTQQTLAPLAQARELDVRVVPAAGADALRAALGELPPGSVAVVCGHSNTVPAVVRALGGQVAGTTRHPQYGELLDEDDYGRLFVCSLGAPGCAPFATELAYGE